MLPGLEVWKWASHTPRWYPKWCLTWWKSLSFGVTSRRCLLPCSARGAGLFLQAWLCWWPLANITFFQVKSNDTTQHEPMLARQKKEFAPYLLQGNMCCLKFQNEQFVLGILLSLFRTVEAKSPSHLTVKLMILDLFKGIFYFLPW